MDDDALTYGPPPRQARGVALLLHGRGGSAADMLGLAQALDVAGVHCVAPQVPGASWYPHSFLAALADNEPKLSQSLAAQGARIEALLARGVPAERLLLCGFSQGACLTAQILAAFPRRYGGALMFTGGLIGPQGTQWPVAGDLGGAPALISGSSRDQHVPEWRMQETADHLRAMGAAVETLFYPQPTHTVTAAEMAAARAYLERIAG